MQLDPTYEDLLREVSEFFQIGLECGRRLGISQMMIDPGIGFGKRQEHNLRLIKGLSNFRSLGYPIVMGPSRKSFIGNILGLPVEDRIEGSIAASVACILYGANILRVHDVKEAKGAAMVADSIKRAAA